MKRGIWFVFVLIFLFLFSLSNVMAATCSTAPSSHPTPFQCMGANWNICANTCSGSSTYTYDLQPAVHGIGDGRVEPVPESLNEFCRQATGEAESYAYRGQIHSYCNGMNNLVRWTAGAWQLSSVPPGTHNTQNIYCATGCPPICTTETCADRGWSCGSFVDDCGNLRECGPVLFNLNQTLGAKTELSTESNYATKVCGPSEVCDATDSNAVLWLSGVTDSNASTSEDAIYDTPVCADNCYIEDGACSSGTLVASMFSETASLVSSGDDPLFSKKICCGGSGPPTPPPVVADYWAYFDGGKAPNGTMFYANSQVRLYSETGSNFIIYDGDNPNNFLPVSAAIWTPTMYDNNLFFNSTAGNSENYIYTSPLVDNSLPGIIVVEPLCGEDFVKGDDLTVKLNITNRHNLVTGVVSIDGALTSFDNRAGPIVEILYPLSSSGNIQIVVVGNNSAGSERQIVNVMTVDPTNNSNQYYVASCIDEPERGILHPSPMIKFNASSTRAIKYNPTDGITEFDINALHFDWRFIYSDNTTAQCAGLGDTFCTPDNPNGYNMYNFEKIFPTVNQNFAFLTVSIPPELID